MKRTIFLALLLAGCAARPAGSLPARAPLDDHFALPPALRVDAAAFSPGPLDFEPLEPRVERFANGVTVYLMEDRSVPLVQLRALVDLGNLDDPEDQTGLAQVTWATLQSGGSGSRSADGTDRALEEMAALLSAGVGDEQAELLIEVRTQDLDRALPIFADFVRRPRFEQGALDRVLAQARDAVVRRVDDAGRVAQVAFAQAIWGKDSPFAREATAKSLGRMKRDDLVALHSRRVRPATTRLMVTGDFDAAAMLPGLQKAFGDWNGERPEARTMPPPPRPRPREIILVPTVGPQAKIRLGHLAPSRLDPRELTLKLLDVVIGGGVGPSRLYSEIRDKRGLAYSVESSISPGPAGGLMLLAADTKPEHAREVIRRCIGTLDEVRGAVPPSEAEVALARDGFVNAFVFRFDTAAGAVHERALRDAQGYPADYFHTFRDRLQAIGAGDVARAAAEVIDPAHLQIVVVGDPERMGDLAEFGPVRTVLGIDGD